MCSPTLPAMRRYAYIVTNTLRHLEGLDDLHIQHRAKLKTPETPKDHMIVLLLADYTHIYNRTDHDVDRFLLYIVASTSHGRSKLAVYHIRIVPTHLARSRILGGVGV